MKKALGEAFVLKQQQDMIYAWRQNAIYQYHFPDFMLLHKQAVYPNISGILLSEEETKLVLLNTEGKMAILDLRDWSLR